MGKLAAPVGLLPFEHYSVPYCRPKEDIEAVPASLGELLTGDKLHSSAYTQVDMLQNRTCVDLCTVNDFSRTEAGKDDPNGGSYKLFERLVRENYRVQMRMDNMPAIELRYDPINNLTYMGLPGFPMGFVVKTPDERDVIYVNNHIGPFRLARHVRVRMDERALTVCSHLPMASFVSERIPFLPRETTVYIYMCVCRLT